MSAVSSTVRLLSACATFAALVFAAVSTCSAAPIEPASAYLMVHFTGESARCFIKSPLEGGALVRYQGLYYLIASHLTGWFPNPNLYATAERLEGPWSEFKDIAPSETKTYGSQSTYLLKVTGSKKTSVVYMGDIWRPKNQADSRYLWMPLELGAGQLRLPPPTPWTIDVKTGEVRVEP